MGSKRILKANVQILIKLSTYLNNRTNITVYAHLCITAKTFWAGFVLTKMSFYGRVCHLSGAACLPELAELAVQVLLQLLQAGEASVPSFCGSVHWLNLFVWEVAALSNSASLLAGQECRMERKCIYVVVMVTPLKEGAWDYIAVTLDFIY